MQPSPYWEKTTEEMTIHLRFRRNDTLITTRVQTNVYLGKQKVATYEQLMRIPIDESTESDLLSIIDASVEKAKSIKHLKF